MKVIMWNKIKFLILFFIVIIFLNIIIYFLFLKNDKINITKDIKNNQNLKIINKNEQIKIKKFEWTWKIIVQKKNFVNLWNRKIEKISSENIKIKKKFNKKISYLEIKDNYKKIIKELYNNYKSLSSFQKKEINKKLWKEFWIKWNKKIDFFILQLKLIIFLLKNKKYSILYECYQKNVEYYYTEQFLKCIKNNDNILFNDFLFKYM